MRINPPPIHRSSEPSSSPRRSLKKENGRALMALPALNILGGHHWPGATPIDRKTLAKVIRAEIGHGA
jgi:hypothetical protein